MKRSKTPETLPENWNEVDEYLEQFDDKNDPNGRSIDRLVKKLRAAGNVKLAASIVREFELEGQ